MEQNKNDILSADILKDRIKSNIEVVYSQTLDSTNNLAKKLIQQGKSNAFLVTCDEQTNGRGRQGKSFYSPKNTGIYMSYVFHPKKDFSDVVSLTCAAGVAVCRAIEEISDLRPEIKWVNDIYLDGKKICGILCEAVSDIENNTINSVIIGIGVNISTIEFPDYVENAACLGRDIKRADLIAEITAQLEEIISLNFGDYIDYYRSHSMIIGKDITFIQNGVSTNAKALEIDSSGGLKVRLDSGESITLRSGEISIRV